MKSQTYSSGHDTNAYFFYDQCDWLFPSTITLLVLPYSKAVPLINVLDIPKESEVA